MAAELKLHKFEDHIIASRHLLLSMLQSEFRELWPGMPMTSTPIIPIHRVLDHFRSYDGTLLGFEILTTLSELNTYGIPPILKEPETLRPSSAVRKTLGQVHTMHSIDLQHAA